MPITHVQTTTGTGSGNVLTMTITFSSPVGVGNAVVGAVRYDIVANISSIVDDKGNSYNFQATVGSGTYTDTVQQPVGGFSTVATFVRGNITNGPTIITITWLSGGANNPTGIADEFSGIIASTTPVDQHTGQLQTTPGLGTDAVTSGLVTTTANGELIYGITWSDTALASVGTGFTLLNSIGFTLAESRIQSTAGSVAATATNAAGGGSDLTLVMTLFPPAAVVQLMGSICL